MEFLYTTATSPTEYQGDALVFLMSHVFGRASDLSRVLKQGLSVSANNVHFVRLIHSKTSEEQGLSLYPDRMTFGTCPAYTIAVALLMHSALCSSLLTQLTTTDDFAEPATIASIPMVELLGGGCRVEAGIK